MTLALLLASCGKSTDAPSAAASTPGSARPAASTTASARLSGLLSAEHRRASHDVLDVDTTDRDVTVRRAAARTLARVADGRSAELLTKTIADEDDEVVVWSAYGLGYACRGREAGVVKTLASRAASLLAARDGAPKTSPGETRDAGASTKPLGLESPLSTIARALGRCGTGEAERTLRAWLGEPSLAEDAALGLGTVAARAGRLEDATLVALLDAASRPTASVDAALYPFARLSSVGAPVRSRLLDVARKKLGGPGAGRAFAVRALALAGEEAAADLGRVLVSPEFGDAERADAARALGRLGAPGQRTLDGALEKLLAEPTITSEAVLATSRFGVLSSLLEALAPPIGKSAPSLARLADLPHVEASAARRRVVLLRCRAADLLADRGTLSQKLLSCDPDPNGRVGRLAFIRVLDRGPLRGARLKRYGELVRADDAVVRERALDLLGAHPEARGAPGFLAEALASKTPGEVATAAALIAKYPHRAGTSRSDESAAEPDARAPEPTLAPPAPAPDAAVVRALTKALDDWSKTANIEVRTALSDAAGALELLGARDRLEHDCKSSHPALREHAEKALGRLGQRGRHCDTFQPDYAPPAELVRLLRTPKKLLFETDAASVELELDPSLAPVAATRLAELARSGFFDGVLVHRVVPGFVVQLGDPGGDGYGGAKGPPLRCETAPVPFEAGTVGIALGGRDTGSSQFFVTLARHPHLDGEYAVVGRASPGWDRVAEGDVVKKVRVGD